MPSLRPFSADAPRRSTRSKTWQQKLDIDKRLKRVVLDAPFAGIAAGQTMLVATPKLVDARMRQIPYGQTLSQPALRAALAAEHGCDATCPVSTGIFVRIAAEAAWDQLQAGASLADVTPFWRVIDPDAPIARKLRCDSAWLARQRASEQASEQTRD